MICTMNMRKIQCERARVRMAVVDIEKPVGGYMHGTCLMLGRFLGAVMTS